MKPLTAVLCVLLVAFVFGGCAPGYGYRPYYQGGYYRQPYYGGGYGHEHHRDYD